MTPCSLDEMPGLSSVIRAGYSPARTRAFLAARSGLDIKRSAGMPSSSRILTICIVESARFCLSESQRECGSAWRWGESPSG